QEDGGQPSLLKALDARDRLWTLLKQRHDVLWRCGAWLYGRAVDDRVPPLPENKAGVRKSKPAPVQGEAAQRGSERNPASFSSAPALRSHPQQNVSTRDHGPLTELERKTKFLIRFGVIPPPR
ncbi:MAG TPA: hypothetical protein VK420_11315, partial [Longimicrobium sp.]|nr:hypothetical protein [Longimicrobium sp.]